MSKQPDLMNVDWSQIPAPKDDGAAAHLKGAAMPSVALQATDGKQADLSMLKGLRLTWLRIYGTRVSDLTGAEHHVQSGVRHRGLQSGGWRVLLGLKKRRQSLQSGSSSTGTPSGRSGASLPALGG